MTGIKEIYEDFHRRSADNKTNGTEVLVLSKSQASRRTFKGKQNASGKFEWKKKSWAELKELHTIFGQG